MKKREKFLLAFLISFLIIMGRYVYVKTKEAIHEGLKDKADYEWLFNDANGDGLIVPEELTEEAKQYFEEQIENEKQSEVEYKEYCEEHPEECYGEIDEHEETIFIKALDKFTEIIQHSDTYYNIATDYNITIFRIFLLTFIIYSILSLELKNMKQYVKDYLKYILVILLVVLVGCGLIALHEYVVTYNSYKILIDDYMGGFAEYFKYMFSNLILIYIVILVLNLVINLIKNRKLKNVNIQKIIN